MAPRPAALTSGPHATRADGPNAGWVQPISTRAASGRSSRTFDEQPCLEEVPMVARGA